MNLDQIGDDNDPIAFYAFYKLVTPALRTVTRRRLRAVFHPIRPCHGTDGRPASLCADCQAVIDDLAMGGYVRLRRAIAADISGTAHPIRELAVSPPTCDRRRQPTRM